MKALVVFQLIIDFLPITFFWQFKEFEPGVSAILSVNVCFLLYKTRLGLGLQAWSRVSFKALTTTVSAELQFN